jgi:hypothetical protein
MLHGEQPVSPRGSFMPSALRLSTLGFIAAAVAVLVAHQVVALILYATLGGANPPYSLRPIPPLGVPAILNSMFWGGLWGIGFAFVLQYLPARWPVWLAGLVLGLGGPWLLGNGIILPLIRGTPILFGLNPANMWRGMLIHGAFGIGWAYIYALLSERSRNLMPAR